jgi:hypothetical protein
MIGAVDPRADRGVSFPGIPCPALSHLLRRVDRAPNPRPRPSVPPSPLLAEAPSLPLRDPLPSVLFRLERREISRPRDPALLATRGLAAPAGTSSPASSVFRLARGLLQSDGGASAQPSDEIARRPRPKGGR